MAEKRDRSDSVSAEIQAMKNAAADTIEPPAHAGLEKKAEPFWHDNIRSKALDSWTPSDLLAAVELANNQLEITLLRKELRKKERVQGEGRDEDVIKTLRKQIVELQRTILAQRRDLQIHSHATNGESRDQRKRNQNDAEARRVLDEMEGDNLLASPVH
ncbi:terminase [Xenorhabdus bovienii]|uniref:terminase n=1 Tax=Xenorhabdus bovienii TaxID=40576 RepID=UPI00237CF85B|nr:terminase [Xenorhabdus bovienii]MDE1488002.1 terminase [Xenorhabdus bovienii]MDE1492693.1 terminase [Xenorhabdus bovienii]MDE9427796.1 terminase [Xenorhabdus bovienii]MDE9478893.1 terminase [Xenorhabdus bovienii]MDE9531692.1 terminase [Xenorhabdus bovienii]